MCGMSGPVKPHPDLFDPPDDVQQLRAGKLFFKREGLVHKVTPSGMGTPCGEAYYWHLDVELTRERPTCVVCLSVE